MRSELEIGLLLEELSGYGYKFTKEFISRDHYLDNERPESLLKAIILDTETTGIDFISDRIIELGMVLFEYCPITGQAYRVLETYDELEDPGISIPPESTKIHGITNTMVNGHHFDELAVQAFIAEASLIIAHNAKFDRAFVEARFPFFQEKAWGCSFSQINWNEEGLGGAKLEFLAYRYGFHYAGHRASNDCHALLEVLQNKLPESGELAMKRLLDNASSKEIRVSAINSKFDTKDILKKRSYRWNGEKKFWSIVIDSINLDSEIEWLRNNIYNNKSFQIELETIDAFNRFSLRSGLTEVITLR
ncbi:3'-5' exonuclease [Methylophilus sp. 'Pure River']|uniref:3'-5' exonuclease n=1 Tax=Methylophilus sp. 'Pure River' TaxID=3377117 RepID=UPI00398F76D8